MDGPLQRTNGLRTTDPLRARFFIGGTPVCRHRPVILLLVLLLVACGDVVSSPSQPPTSTPLTFTLLGDLLGRNMPLAGAEVTTVGYVVVGDSGARLLDGMSFSTGDTPQP